MSNRCIAHTVKHVFFALGGQIPSPSCKAFVHFALSWVSSAVELRPRLGPQTRAALDTQRC